MKTTVRIIIVAFTGALASACATFDEPIDSPGNTDGRQDSQRLLIPGVTDQNEIPEPAPLPSTAGGRLNIPGNDTDAAAPEEVTDAEATDASGDDIQNDIVEPIALNNTATEPQDVGPRLHHRTNDISVVTWRAERGHVPSQLLLGRAYARGDGVPKSMDEARLWLELAAVQGNHDAQFELGLMYFIGAGLARDYDSARSWWLESAQNGNDKAQQRLGYMYSEALGVERDYTQARDWYLKAANLGNAEAQTLLGSLYHEGNRIAPDYQQAFKWYTRAAEQGHSYAQYALGILHHDGLGTEQDYIKCAAWIDVAVANQYADELGARSLCRDKLDAQQNSAADSLASLWKTQYAKR